MPIVISLRVTASILAVATDPAGHGFVTILVGQLLPPRASLRSRDSIRWHSAEGIYSLLHGTSVNERSQRRA